MFTNTPVKGFLNIIDFITAKKAEQKSSAFLSLLL